MLASKFKHYFSNAITRSLVNVDHQVVAVGAILFFGFPLLYGLWSLGTPVPDVTLWSRGATCFLGLGLILYRFWPNALKRCLPAYWLFTLCYAFSFFFAYSFLVNEASVMSAMLLLCSIFFLLLLVEFPLLVLLTVCGWGLAFLVYYFSAEEMFLAEEHWEMLLLILFILIAGSILNYRAALIQQQRLAGMAAVAGMIAHELRTPLSGIKSGANAAERYTPELLQGYHLACKHHLLPTTLRPARIQQLSQINSRIIAETDYANTIIDMLLLRAGGENALKNSLLEHCSMADCIFTALERYPFKSKEERQLIKWQGDFQFYGSKLLMQHVLFNLLKNALYAIATARKGDIHLWTAVSETHNCLYFRDTAKGMDASEVSRLFNHFYTTTFMGTGLGLSFCKLVIQHFGGDIFCEAKAGEFTQFMLTFPIESGSTKKSTN